MEELEVKDSPVEWKLSFAKLIDTMLESEEVDQTGGREVLETYLADVLSTPELREGIDFDEIEKYRPQVDKLMGFVFPAALKLNEIKMACSPFRIKPFYLSKRMQNLVDNAGSDYQWDTMNFGNDEIYTMICSTIMTVYYKRPVNVSRPYHIRIPDGTTGEDKFYRMTINADFVDLKPKGEPREITDADFKKLMDSYGDVEVWREYFPKNSWTLNGFNLFSFIDVTQDVIIKQITDDLLQGGKNGMLRLRNNLRNYLGIEDLRLSMLNLNGDTLVQGGFKGLDHLGLGKEDMAKHAELLCDHASRLLIDSDEPLILSSVKDFHAGSQSVLSANLVKKRIRSYAMIPILHEGEKLGFMELASAEILKLNSSVMIKLESILPTLTTAAGRYRSEHINRIEAVIQEECTSIHPTVFWRFEQEANEFINAEERGKSHVFEDMVFPEVYPLFGQLDIRGSSTLRNEALKSDLSAQLSSAHKILKMALKENKLPLYEELMFRLDQCVAEVKDHMAAGSEHQIMRFLSNEVDPVFNHLRRSKGKLGEAVASYSDSLSEEVHMRYEERKKFDESVTQINKVLSNFLDKAQVEAQKMFPHYYERYKTDGVEFNMYIGQSLTKAGIFDELYVKNLRLWQLMVMADMENEFHQLKKTLQMPLDVASLILVYSTPLAIHFRMDEKRFDVEGTYNARYEVIKKRIDKAKIAGTDERLTCPGKISIVYTKDEDEIEYSKYVDFLGVKGYLAAEQKELLRVEDLQGVTGLRAIRVPVLLKDTGLQSSLSIEQLMDEIEKEGSHN